MRRTAQILLAAATVALTVAFTSCRPEPQPEPEQPFVGTYHLTVVTDSVGIGEDMYSNLFMATIGRGEPLREGTLTITSDDGNLFTLKAQYAAEGSTSIFAYETTGHLRENGLMVVDTCQDLNSAFEATYILGPIRDSSVLEFRAEMRALVGGMDCRYVMTSYAEKTE